MLPAQVLGTAEKCWNQNIEWSSSSLYKLVNRNGAQEDFWDPFLKTSPEQIHLGEIKLESLGIIEKDAKNLTLDLLWSSSVTCDKANVRQLIKTETY